MKELLETEAGAFVRAEARAGAMRRRGGPRRCCGELSTLFRKFAYVSLRPLRLGSFCAFAWTWATILPRTKTPRSKAAERFAN